MKKATNVFLAALVGFAALPFCSCKSEIDKAGKVVDESTEKAKEQTGWAMEKAGQAIKEAGEKLEESGKAEKKEWHSPLRIAPTVTKPAAPLCHFHGLRARFIEARLKVSAAMLPSHIDGRSHIVR
jgi:hypothetical protein